MDINMFGIVLIIVCGFQHSQAETHIGCLDNATGDGLRHCYGNFHSAVTWIDAANSCKEQGMRLAVIPNQNTQDLIGTYMIKQVPSGMKAWLSGKEDTSQKTWYWLNGQKYKGRSIQWESEYATCAILKVDPYSQKLSLNGVHCTGRRHFICSYTSCQQDGTVVHDLKGNCYKRITSLDTNEKTWFAARQYCLDSGGDLASLDNMNLSLFNTALTGIIGTNAEYWVGLRIRRWFWDFGNNQAEDIVFADWYESRPDNQYENCLAIRGDKGLWDDDSCTNANPYICETIIPIPTPSNPPASTSSTSSSSPSSSSSVSSSTDDSNDELTKASITALPASGETDEPPGLTLGLLVTIVVVAVLVFLVVLIVLVVLCVKRKNKKKEDKKKHTYDNVSFYHYGDSVPSRRHLPLTPMATYADIIHRQEKQHGHQSNESLSGDSGVVDTASTDNLVTEIIGGLQVVHIDKSPHVSNESVDHPPDHDAPPPPLPPHRRGFQVFGTELQQSIDSHRARTSSADTRPRPPDTYAKPVKRRYPHRPPSMMDLMAADDMHELPVDVPGEEEFAVPYNRYTMGVITKV